MERHFFKYESIKNMMLAKTVSDKEEIMEKAINEYREIIDDFKEDKTSYVKVPSYIIPTPEDDVIDYDTRLLAMYIFGVKKLIITTEKINELFGCNYTSLAKAKAMKFNNIENYGIDLEVKKVGRRIVGYIAKVNYKKAEIQSKESGI